MIRYNEKTKMQALGRLKVGEMNKTEAAYKSHLEMLKSVGDVAWYRFEGVHKQLFL